MHSFCHFLYAFAMLLLFFSCQLDSQQAAESELEEIPQYLPFNSLDLNDMPELKINGSNWSIKGGVKSDFSKEWDLQTTEGTGILINHVEDIGKRDAAGQGEHLFTDFEHGDMEFEIDFMVPKGSNSGLYFMSRYELQIRETHDDPDLSSDDCGGIYAQWKEPGNHNETIGGKAPNVKAVKAPGLWQNYKVLFRAPKFDENGNKTQNAKFEHVYHNGYLIHEDVEVAGPTIEAFSEEEVAKAPLMIQGDHGPVAFRNIKYKLYGEDTVRISDLTYNLYEEEWDYLPDYQKFTPSESGEAESFINLTDISGHNDHFGLKFTAQINLPKDGDYLFETIIDDGGNLFIDEQLVVHNEGETRIGTERGIINLNKGVHILKLSYYQEIGNALLVLNIEGPEMEKRPYLSADIGKLTKDRSRQSSMTVQATDEVKMLRGFVDHRDKKYTHTLSVGNPEGVHYSYDTRNNALLNLWRGDYADVTEMWVGRGHSQKLKPFNAILELNSGIPISVSKSKLSSYLANDERHDPKGFRLDKRGRPTFLYQYGEVSVEEEIIPGENSTMRRTLSFENFGLQSVSFRLASDKSIFEIDGSWLSVGGNYYIMIDNGRSMTTVKKMKITEDLIYEIPLGTSTLSYNILW